MILNNQTVFLKLYVITPISRACVAWYVDWHVLCDLNCIGNQHENAVCTNTVVHISEQEI